MRLKNVAIAGLAITAVAVPTTLTVSAYAQDAPPAAGEFFSDPASNARQWLADNPDNPSAETIRSQIAEQAGAKWYGDWENTPLRQYVADAAEAGQTPILVAYNMYQRDCDGQSGGGADTAEEYRTWISGFAADLGDSDAIVIVEPDALAQLIDGCVAEPDTRRELLAYAVSALSSASGAQIYLDAGNAEWPGSAAEVARELEAAGIDDTSGFAVNVSNHYTTAESDDRAAAINAELANPTGYVVDTSRNGSGKTQDGADAWCNPEGATLGQPSTATPDDPADAHLWIKFPGDSDGSCGYGPGIPAGQFSEKLAMALITGQY